MCRVAATLLIFGVSTVVGSSAWGQEPDADASLDAGVESDGAVAIDGGVEQPSETSEDASEEESANVYVGGTRAPVYRHHIREEVREDNPRELRAEPQPHEPPHASPPRRGAHR